MNKEKMTNTNTEIKSFRQFQIKLSEGRRYGEKELKDGMVVKVVGQFFKGLRDGGVYTLSSGGKFGSIETFYMVPPRGKKYNSVRVGADQLVQYLNHYTEGPNRYGFVMVKESVESADEKPTQKK